MDVVSLKRQRKSSTKIDRKESAFRKGLICTVCGAAATGFNFSVITCMCCKAFFRRNALVGLQSLQCRYLTDNCFINTRTRRDCSYCRLNKCFQVGMKKELILTEEIKRIKREKVLANRQATLTLIRPMNLLISTKNLQLNDIDSSYLTNIYNTFEEYCRLPVISFEKHEYELVCQQPVKERIKMQHYFRYFENCQTSLKDFFKRIPEFKQLSDNQQVALSTHNIRFLVRISLIETTTDQLLVWSGIYLLLETMFGKSLMEQISILTHNLKYLISDSICIRLILIIFLFSTYSTYGDTDTLHIYKIQEKYTELLWLYLQQRYNDLIACQKFSIIIRYCLHLQTIGHIAELKRQENTN
jgi:hypothetical protein